MGRIRSVKGADLLAAAAQRLRAHGVHFTLTVAASLEAADQAILEVLSPVAQMLGQVPHEQLKGHYASADCVITPSRFDSFNLVVAEGLASGAPVIVTDHVGAMDMVENDRNYERVSTAIMALIHGRKAA